SLFSLYYERRLYFCLLILAKGILILVCFPLLLAYFAYIFPDIFPFLLYDRSYFLRYSLFPCKGYPFFFAIRFSWLCPEDHFLLPIFLGASLGSLALFPKHT